MNVWTLQDWKNVQALVGKTGKEGLKRRCLECVPYKINPDAAKRSKELLGGYDLDDVRDVSAGAATFFVWVSNKIVKKYVLTVWQSIFCI